MDTPLLPNQLDALKKITTPTISNAVETFNIRPRNQGFMGPEIRCFFPKLGPMVGYACTAVIEARTSPSPGQAIDPLLLWEEMEKTPEPRVLVIEDLNYPRVIGSFWGEVNSNIYKSLGCVGTVTDGGVRDLDEVEELGFHFFATQVLVSHAYVHIQRVGGTVSVGGIEVHPGDLIHGDQHGVILIPLEIAGRVAEAARQVEEWERPIIQLCKSADFSLDKLHELYKRPRPSN